MLIFLFTVLVHLCIDSNQAIGTVKPEERDIEKKWHDYVKTYKDFYDDLTEDNEQRKQIFVKRMREIEKWNEEYKNNKHSFALGASIFTARSEEERKRMFHMHQVQSNQSSSLEFRRRRLRPKFRPSKKLPKSLDWRKKGVVPDVMFQGHCQSCYAMSVADSLAAQYAIKTGKLTPLSSQMIIDCSKDRNKGCKGGYLQKSFQYIIEQNGIATEEDYKFKKKDGECRDYLKKEKYSMKDYFVLPEGDEDYLKRALAEVGPIAVSLDADLKTFEDYRGEGVYDDPKCKSTNLTHTGLLVGYGTEKGKDYWIIKNNWSTIWGHKGYIKIRRNNNNRCGVATYAMYPII